MSEQGSSRRSSINSEGTANGDRGPNTVQDGLEDADNADIDLQNNNKTIRDTMFATIYTLTNNRGGDTSVRMAVLKVVLEFLQLFCVVFNTSFPWRIRQDLWVYRAIQWVLFRMLVQNSGYNKYIIVMYCLMFLMVASTASAMWLAVVYKGEEPTNIWHKRLVAMLRLNVVISCAVFWPACLDFTVFMFDCKWSNLSSGQAAYHLYFTNQNCLAMPHIIHMVVVIFGAMLFIQSVLEVFLGMCDQNPLTRSLLARSDTVTTLKVTCFKMLLVIASAVLDDLPTAQLVIMMFAALGIFHCYMNALPFYNNAANLVWCGLSAGLLLSVGLLAAITFGRDKGIDPEAMTWALLYGIFPAVAVGAAWGWVRMQAVNRLSAKIHRAFKEPSVETALPGSSAPSASGALNRRKTAGALSLASRAAGAARASKGAPKGSTVVALMADMKAVHKWRDVRQVSLVLREMRVWDEDGVPDPQAAEFGEFVLKCAMARLPSNPELLLLHANFLIEVHKDGQAAHAQIQLAQKSNPGLLDSYSIYAAQQMSKKLQKESDGLDLFSYVEFQRNYRACVRAHKLALMAQRQFWSSLLRDSVRLVDLQASIQLMEQSEQRATAVYRRVLERYPSNGKVLKVYGRFLEFVRNEPGTAAKYYSEALKQGTTDSMLAMTGHHNIEALTAAVGVINEKRDGLVIINAQGIIMMINAAALGLFGYEKGELEGKNVSVLMPAPLSTHHNSFLERYTRSGEPRILNIPRPMVALHKNRSLFPISLCATHISGSGDDCMFFGVVKPSPPPVAEGRPVVRFWTNHAGTVLCVDRNVADNFGHATPELVGMSFSSLCTDVEGVDSYLSTALREVSKQYHDVASLEVDEVASEPEDTTFVAQVIHGYLPPVDVELSVEFGGVTQGQSDCRTICIQAAVLSESAATLVLDHKARVVYATDKLAAMLGYPVASLLKMELGALLPQPYCQMHGTWFKDLTRKPGANSCRAGAVVHMLAANGGKVPVKLKMTTRESARDGSSTNVVQVAKASASDEQGQRRLLLSINHKGTILQVNKDTPKALYGFEPSQLLGRPLAAALDVFGHWRHHFGEDGSLLALVAEHSMDEESVQGSGSGGRSSAVGPSWRVGVHLPVKSDDDIAAHAALMATDTHLGAQGHVQASSTALTATGGSNTTLTADQASTFLHTLQQRNQLRPVCMTMAVIAQGGDLVVDEEQADLLPVLQVSLFRADALSSLIELDNRLSVTHADEAAGLMFGVNAKQLLKKNFARLVGLAPSTTFEDLLGSKLAKGAMKAAASGTQPVYPGASHMGGVKTVTARHLADGQLLALELQALSCSQGSKTRYLVRLQLHEPASSSLPALLQLKEGKAAAAAATVAMPPACTGSGQELAGDASAAMSQSGAEYEHSASADNRCSSDGRGSQGVRQASRLSDDGDEEAPMTVKHHLNGGYKERQAAAAVAASEDDGASAVYKSAKYGNRRAAGLHNADAMSRMQKGRQQSSSDDDGDSDDGGSNDGGPAAGHLQGYAGTAAPSIAGPVSVAESASVFDAGSVIDGASEAPSSMSSAAGEGGHEEDLSVDTRRAKRLKKLNHMVQSNAAQTSTSAWKRHTLALLAIMLVARIICFVVLGNEVADRRGNAIAVADMARVLDRFQSSTLRMALMQKCYAGDFLKTWSCSQSRLNMYEQKLRLNLDLAEMYHKKLFLKEGGLRIFDDPRLQYNWTYATWPEKLFFQRTANGSNVLADGHRTLWEMGNVYINAGREVLFRGYSGDPSKINESVSWQYAMNNGPASIFSGNAWSLDICVDHSVEDLVTLSLRLIILLIIEVVVVQLGCMAYEFYLLQRCNVSHMRLFSMFLALPSATVRLMAARQLQVDDDSREEVDEDELEALPETAATATEGDGANGADVAAADGGEKKSKQKSVRLDAGLPDDDDADDMPAATSGSKTGKGEKLSSGKGSSSSSKERSSDPEQRGTRLDAVHKALFGWMDPKIKKNGKKLLGSNAVTWRFMLLLGLWAAVLAAMYGISFSQVLGVREQLMSLDMAAHVQYRLGRCRHMANFVGYSDSHAVSAEYKARLQEELAALARDYKVLLYGGDMVLAANVSFVPVAPSAVLGNPAISDMFFTTKSCLRNDQSTCFPAGSQYYDITHSGLGAMIEEFISQMTSFSNLPDEQANATASSFVWMQQVIANDGYDALNKAIELFATWTINRLDIARQLHIGLLCICLACIAAFLLALYRPYILHLRRDTKAVAGLLSQLPSEVDVERHVKSMVLGITSASKAGGQSTTIPASGTQSMWGSVKSKFGGNPGAVQVAVDAYDGAGMYGCGPPGGFPVPYGYGMQPQQQMTAYNLQQQQQYSAGGGRGAGAW